MHFFIFYKNMFRKILGFSHMHEKKKNKEEIKLYFLKKFNFKF
jgi:hypothetical protein